MNQLSISSGLSYSKMIGNRNGTSKYSTNKRITHKANWKNRKIGIGNDRILKSGNVNERFSIKLDSVGNLLRAIEEM